MVSKKSSPLASGKEAKFVQEDVGHIRRFVETVYLVPKLEPHHRANETKKYRNSDKNKHFDAYGWYKNTIFCDPGHKPKSYGSTITTFETLPVYCSSRVYIPMEDTEKRYVYSITENFFSLQFGGSDVSTTHIRAMNQHVTTVDQRKISSQFNKR